jgi:hypothetical protein
MFGDLTVLEGGVIAFIGDPGDAGAFTTLLVGEEERATTMDKWNVGAEATTS